MTKPWLTIVTVVRDDLAGLQRTLSSISASGAADVQVIVVDSSSDRESVAATCAGIADVHWVEPEGIYPAMNIGLSLAEGHYVQFLNAGDMLHDDQVLNRVRLVAEGDPSWMFGPVRIVDASGSSTVTPPWDYPAEARHLFSRGHFPQHQGTFMGTELLRSADGFDARYRIAADYAAFLKVSRLADPVVLDFVIADFFEGGASTEHWRAAFDEFHRARLEVFSPKGTGLLIERWNTWIGRSKVWAYRTVVAPLRARR